MVLSKEKTEEIIKKIEESIKKKRGQDSSFSCFVCTNNQFSLAGGFTNDFLIDNFGGGLFFGGPVLPSVPIVCTNCGNTIFLNAKVLGLKEEDFKKENSNSGESKSG